MATRKDQVQISIAFITDESKEYAKLIQENQQFIRDIQKAKAEGKDLSETIRQMAASGQNIAKIPIDKLAPAQLVTRANQLKQVLDLIPASAPEYAALASEYKKINDLLAEQRAQTRGVAQAMNDLRQNTGIFSQAGQTLAGVLGALGLANIGDQILAFGQRLFGIGTGLDTLLNKTKTVFGQSESIVQGFAEKNARSLGLARQEYVNLATSAGDLLKPMGFTEQAAAQLSATLVDQAGVLSEWTGGKVNTERASEVLTKALLGERDALNELGIDIKDSLIQDELKRRGLDKLTGESRRQAEALITLQQITAQSASANEAFAKNTDSLVRKKSELRARLADVSQTLATALVPVINLALTVGLRLLDWAIRFGQVLASIPAFVRDNQVAIGLLITSLAALNAQGILAAANALRMAAAQRAATIATTAQAAAQRVLNFVLAANPIGLVISAVAALAAVFVTAYNQSETFRRIVTGVFDAITTQVKGVIGFFGDLGSGLSNLFQGNFEASANSFSNAFKRINPFELAKSMKESFVEGYNSVPTPPAQIKGDENQAQQEGNKVGEAFAGGFDKAFADLKNNGQADPKDIAKAAKERLQAALEEVDIEFAKEELVALKDRNDGKYKTEEAFGNAMFLLQERQLRSQLAVYEKFGQAQVKEALAIRKQLLEIEAQKADPRALTDRQRQFGASNDLATLPTRRGAAPVSQDKAVSDIEAIAQASGNAEMSVVRDKFAALVDMEQQHELRIAEIRRNAAAARLQMLLDAGLSETEAYRKAMDEKAKADEDYTKKKLENEERSAKLKSEVEQASLQATQDTFAVAVELLSQDEQARKKNAAAIKAFQSAQVITNGVMEVQKIWATVASYPPPFNAIIGGVLTGVAVARTGLALAKIQSTKFAGGGYTGTGAGIAPDNSGHRPVGVVHNDEWVGPKWMTQHPVFGPQIASLEAIRQRGYAEGGFSTTPTVNIIPGPSSSSSSTGGMSAEGFVSLISEFRQFRNQIEGWQSRLRVAYTDIEEVGGEVVKVRAEASI